MCFFHPIERCKQQSSAVGGACTVCRRNAYNWVWVCHRLRSSRGSLQFLKIEGALEGSSLPTPPSSSSTSSLSFFHGLINVSQGCISNWLQTVCSGFRDERGCQNRVGIFCHCRPPGGWGWCLLQLIWALWDTWRNAQGTQRFKFQPEEHKCTKSILKEKFNKIGS